MPENKKEANAQVQSSKQVEERSEDARDAASLDDLDLENLDLSIETVEERISPSETNVFDK